MRHKRIGRKLGVTTKHRKSMFRNMVTDLFRFDRIKTTDMKAKELKRIAEKLITLAKEGTLHKRRQAAAYIRDKDVLKRLFDEIAAKFKDRPGGYTRIIKLGFRKGDNTAVSIIELVEEEYKPAKKKKAKTAAKKEQTKAAETGAAKKPRAKSSKKEAAEELGLIEEGQAAPAEPETKPAEQAETPAAQETQPEAEELKAAGADEGAETVAESEAPAGDKKEE
jgi:large subunit ribosomal protein L17